MHARTAVPLESSSPLAAALRRKFARTFACGLLHQTKRVLVAVDEHAPCARLAGIAAESVVEGVANHVGGVLLDARPDSLVRRSWARRLVRLTDRAQLGEDVLHGANVLRDIVDGRHLRHPLSVTLLALGQARPKLPGRRRRGLAGRGAQMLVEHRNPFAIEREHEEVLCRSGNALARRVERVEVLRCASGELFDLALADWRPGGRTELRGHLVERAARCALGGPTTQLVGIQLARQVSWASIGWSPSTSRAW